MSERNSSLSSEESDNKAIDCNEYTVSVRTTPFGIEFNNQNPLTNKIETDSVFIKHVSTYSPCYNQIIVGSKLIKLQNQTVEGLKCAEIMKMFKIVYSNCVNSKSPLHMTLRKPPSENGTIVHETDCQRVVFLDINLFFKVWRTLPSNVLLDALLIFPHIDIEWISRKTTRQIINQKYSRVLNDSVFRNLLQWKNQQGLLLTVNQKNNLTFWGRLSDTLVGLADPTTYKTSTYNPLKLDVKYYKNVTFKYNVSVKGIQKAMHSHQINVNVIKEMLHQSNPTLHIYEKKAYRMHHSNFNDTLSMSLNESEIDEILDEIDCLYEDNNTCKRHVFEE